jgi:hypothetical protein
MATSYTTGKPCDVSIFDARYKAGDTFASWKDFCDCMFLEHGEVTVFKCNGIPILFPPGTPADDRSRATVAQEYCKRTGGAYSISVVPSTRRTENWTKCVSNFCALPGGCKNDLTGLIMPFNMSPFIAAPPWTDGGAASRGIPKQDASVFFTLVQAVSIDLDAYEPLRLWTTFWENPFLFGLLMAKITLIPGAGLIYQLGLTATVIPFALIPAASASAQRQGKDPDKALLDPVVKGSIKSAGLVLKYLGKCGVGINIPCGAGLVIQKGAQDQIDTGEINKVGDPVTRGVIAFLAKSGDKLVDSIINSIGDTWGGGVFAVLESGFAGARDALAEAGEAAAAKVLDVLRMVAGIGQIIASGINEKLDFLVIADNVAEKILGFRPSVYFGMLKTNATSAIDYAKTVLTQKGTTVETLVDLVSRLAAVFDEVIKALNDISSKIGGGLDEIILAFQEAKGSFTAAGNAVGNVGQQVSAATQAALTGQPIPALRNPLNAIQVTRVTSRTSEVPLRQLVSGAGPSTSVLDAVGTQLVTPPATTPPADAGFTFTKGTKISSSPAGTSASSPGSSQSASSAGALLVGAGLGFAVAGPIGALGGAALSMLTSSPPKQYAPPVQVAKVIETMQSNPQATIRQTTNIGPRLNLNLSGFDADYMMDTRARAPVVQPKQIDITASTDSLGPPPDYAVTRFIPQPVAPAQPPAPEPVPVVITEATPVPAPAPAPSPSPVAVGPARPAVFVPGSPTYIPPEKRGVLTPDEPVVSAEPLPLPTKDKGGFNLWWLVVLGAAYKFAQARSTVL